MSLRWFGVILAAGVFSSGSAFATPTFALREGTTCRTCHTSPTGGGMRNRYGRYVYGTTRLPMGYLHNRLVSKVLDADISDSLALGADARTAFIFQRSEPEKDADLNSMIAMQADLYVAATPFRGLTLYYDQGTYGSFEMIGMYDFRFGPAVSGYVKAGHYTPAYGLRVPNHRIFTREDLGFGPRDKDTGAEAGLYLGPMLVQVGVVNGAGPEFKLDDNSEKGVVGRVEVLERLGDFRLMLGGSAYFNSVGKKTGTGAELVDTRNWQTRVGAHWGASFGRFTYLGEGDVRKIVVGAGATTQTKEYSFRSYQELAVLIVRGLDLTLTYEFREPDLYRESGVAHRIGGGFEFYPIPSTEIKVLYRRSFGSGPVERAGGGFNEFIGMLHLFL